MKDTEQHRSLTSPTASSTASFLYLVPRHGNTTPRSQHQSPSRDLVLQKDTKNARISPVAPL